MSGLSRSGEGQGLVEYALIIVLVAIVVAVALTGVGTQLSDLFDDIVADLQPITGDAPPENDCYGSLLLPFFCGLTLCFSLTFWLLPTRSSAEPDLIDEAGISS
jgi:pilus assembly protein Flp/PilA